MANNVIERNKFKIILIAILIAGVLFAVYYFDLKKEKKEEKIKNMIKQGPPSRESFEHQMPPEFQQTIPQEFQQFSPPIQQPPPSSEPMPQILPFKNLIDNAKALILEILR